jgi:hypothetical protein
MFRSTLTAPRFLGTAALLFTLSFSTFANNNNPTDPKERDAQAAKYVALKLQTWQDRMNLKGWDIRFEMVRSEQLEPKTLGNIHWDTDVKTAKILVLAPQDYKLPYKEMLDDMEFTVVHELVHLELASLPRSDASRRTEERAVNEIASALLKLARR